MSSLDSIVKSRDITLPVKVCIVKTVVFPAVMYRLELVHKESWVLKSWCFGIVVLEKTLENSLDSKEIQPVHPKGNQFWMFIECTDAEVKAPILWPPDVKSQLIGKDLNAGKDWGQEKNRVTEDEMVGWHHQLNGYEFEQTLRDSEWQGKAWCAAVHGVSQSRTLLTDWTTTNVCVCVCVCVCIIRYFSCTLPVEAIFE